MPSPFPIPVFRKSAQAALDGGVLKEADRKYVVQTLATILMTHVQRPSLSQCGFVAKALIDKYPPLNEGGDGEVCRNLLSNVMHTFILTFILSEARMEVVHLPSLSEC